MSARGALWQVRGAERSEARKSVVLRSVDTSLPVSVLIPLYSHSRLASRVMRPERTHSQRSARNG